MNKALKAAIYFLFPDRNTGLLQPHLGSDYLISLLCSKGHNASRILSTHGENFKSVFEKLKNQKFDYDILIFGFTCYDANYCMIKLCISLIKRIFPDSYIVMGGPTATFNDDIILMNNPDISLCFRGESEKSILRFIENIEKDKKTIYEIENTSYIKNGKVMKNGDNCVLNTEEINNFPSAICFSQYNPKDIIERYGKLSITTSRGCPHNCTFCAFSAQSQHRVRYYSLGRVMSEIKYIDEKLRDIEEVEKKKVVIEDDCFTLNKNHFNSIINAIKELKPDLKFECQTRPDYLNHDILKSLKDAGFFRVDISLESTDPTVLYNCRKVNTIKMAEKYADQVKQIISWCKSLSLECFTTLMCGLPHDTEESLNNTYNFIKDNSPTGYYWNNLKIFTGTDLFENNLKNFIQEFPSEERFNSVTCNKITYSKISNYNPQNIKRLGDDVSWKNRKEMCKNNIFRLIISNENFNSLFIALEYPFDFKKHVNNMINLLPLDSQILLMTHDSNEMYFNSFNLAELFSIAYFKTNSNENIYNAINEMSPRIVLENDESFNRGHALYLSNEGVFSYETSLHKYNLELNDTVNFSKFIDKYKNTKFKTITSDIKQSKAIAMTLLELAAQ